PKKTRGNKRLKPPDSIRRFLQWTDQAFVHLATVADLAPDDESPPLAACCRMRSAYVSERHLWL
ncbi:hypothetical protein PQR02_40345, partial [Paraburkholderia sediminicola]